MTEAKKSLAKRLAEKYRRASEAAPEAKLALDLHPITGIGMSALDSAASAAEGMYGDAALEALGMVPGVKPARGLSKALRFASQKAQLARGIDRSSDAVQYATTKAEKAKEVPPKGSRTEVADAKSAMKRGGVVKPKGVGKALRGWGRAGR
jgi:hypothetical protein